LLLRVEYVGGGACIESCDFLTQPEIVILVDGTSFTPRNRIHQPFAVRTMPDRIDDIHDAARAAGLLVDGDRPLLEGAPTLSESMTLRITYRDPEGTPHVVTAYGIQEHPLTPERRKLRQFLNWVDDLVGADRDRRTASAVAARVSVIRPEDSPVPYNLDVVTHWPLTEPLATFGEPSSDVGGTCAVIDREQLRLVMNARGDSRGMPYAWRSDGEVFIVHFDLLMPTEALEC
jgi:uncharacterized protein Usg